VKQLKEEVKSLKAQDRIDDYNPINNTNNTQFDQRILDDSSANFNEILKHAKEKESDLHKKIEKYTTSIGEVQAEVEQ